MFAWIRCVFQPHEPNRRKVRKTRDGEYIGVCAYCHAAIRRKKRNKWVRDWRPNRKSLIATAIDPSED